MNPFKDTLYIEKDGVIFTLHWKNRHASLATAVMIAGVATQTVSSYMQSVGQAKSMQAQGEAALVQGQNEQTILEHNAKLKEREGEAALESAKGASRRFAREGEALQASQNVAIAKGGVLSSSGTPALLMEDTAKELEEDRMSILREGYLNQSMALSQASNLRASGAAALSRGQFTNTNLRSGAVSVKRGGMFQAGSTLLSGLTQIGAARSGNLTRTA